MSSTIKIKTETEQLLYKYYTDERAQREKLQSLVDSLTNQVEVLQQQLNKVQEQQHEASAKKQIHAEKSSDEVQYETDEEELAKETEWVRQKSWKKRKLNVSLSPLAEGSKPDEKQNQGEKTKKTPLPPPIVVENINNYQEFYDLLVANLTNDSFVAKMMNGERVKINSSNAESYRTIDYRLTSLLLQNNCYWYSYENKQDRPIRVMAKKLHSSCAPKRIIEDLESQGYKIQDAVNKLSWRSKEPLNMFMLSFDKNEDVNRIYNIKTILGCKVDIQPLKTSKLLPQCKRCQAYGHTQKYCSKEPRCVKCTGKHLTRDCTKPTDTKPKCVHCGEAHPASYRGCVVAKELQQLKNKLTKPSPPTTSQLAKANQGKNRSTSQEVTKNISYAQIARGKLPQQKQKPQPISSNSEDKLNTILNLLTSFDNRLQKLENSTKTATLKHKQ
uniref:Pre-C2HC domain-containing protein n=1 Tax=Heliothis virescens TaxID=7102 RepID=A0A2A4JZV6_HELVI